MTWWLERLDQTSKVSDGWLARCPAHNDPKGSLHLSETSDGVLVHCFAGCKYDDILSAVSNGHAKVPVKTAAPATKFVQVEPQTWWEEYTGIPWAFWADLGVTSDRTSLIFSWAGLRATKRRRAGSKEFTWQPSSASAPPLWPMPSKELPDTVFLTEGESDCGVLRWCGFEAFGVTKGAASKPGPLVWKALLLRGVKYVYMCFDADSPGLDGARGYLDELAEVGLTGKVLNVGEMLESLFGEKDIRDAWKRIHDVDAFRASVLSLIRDDTSGFSYVSVDQLLEMPMSAEEWAVQDVWLDQTVGMIVGSPKMKKSWLALDLCLSIASGASFLGKFPTKLIGPTVYIPKEDPPHLLQDRIAKMMIAKGFGGSFEPGGPIRLPPVTKLPFYFDLAREFAFEPGQTSKLMNYLDKIAQKHGSLGLVVLDPVLRMLVDTDEFKASEVGSAIFNTATEIQRRFLTSVCLVHHRAKGSTTGKSSYGSVAFHAFSEATLYIAGEEADSEGWHHVRGEYKSAADTAWAYRFSDLKFEYAPEAIEKDVAIDVSSTGTNEDAVLLMLSQNPSGMTANGLAGALDGPSDFTVRDMLKKLEAKGSVRRVKSDSTGKSGARADVWFFVD